MEKSLFGGKVIVIAQAEAFEKPLPGDIDQSYDWIGNFGLRTTGPTTAEYEVLIEKQENRLVVWWNGQRAVSFPSPAPKNKNGKDFLSVRLNQVDPPIGYGK